MTDHQSLGERASGVLLHPTSLPGPHGAGDLGAAARAFADYLAAAGQSWWQMLPVCPPGFGCSPYYSASSFAGSPWLISLSDLAAEGLLEADDLMPAPGFSDERVDYEASGAFRESRLRRAFERFRARGSKNDQHALEQFRAENWAWLDGWTMFSAFRDAGHGSLWTSWPEGIRRRDSAALAAARRELADEIAYHELIQFLFARQWRRLHEHCRSQGIRLLGDVPMFVAHDGADVWSNQELFFLDQQGHPTHVAGVPPDAFSETGQLWGNPLYRWERMAERDFDWWIARLRVTLERFDAVRLDHFIGFRNYWEISAGAADARGGRWVWVPGERLFERARATFHGLPFIAEDLGMVTPEVTELRERFELPGMRVIQFAFGSDDANDYRPHRYIENTVVYTGTHDNDTTLGWFTNASAEERARVLRYFGSNGDEIHWDLIRAALASVAGLAIFPMQDALGLGSEARMNVPATSEGNWRWRARIDALAPSIATRLRSMCFDYERSARVEPGDLEAFLRCGITDTAP